MNILAYGKTKLTSALALALTSFAAVAALPEDYTALDYIRGTGKSWILTDVTPTCTDTVEMVVEFTDTSANQALFCSRGNDLKEKSLSAFLVWSEIRMDRDATQFTTTFKPTTAQKYDFVFNFRDYAATMGGSSKTCETVGADFTPGSKLVLFASHTAGTGVSATTEMSNVGTYKLYSFVLTGSDGTVRMNLVPAKNSDAVVGLYDTVAGTFYSSMNDTPFIAASTEKATWTDEDEDKRVLNVPDDVTYALTADDVTTLVESGRNLVIRGKGTTQGVVALTGFTKDIVIEGGIFSMQVKDCFGPNEGTVTIKNGAAISVDKAVGYMISLKDFYFEGTGPDGKGAIRAMADQWNAFRNSKNWNGPHNKFYMTGDAKIYQPKRVDYISFIDTCGHDLEITGTSIFGTSYITNSSATVSHVIDKGARLYLAQNDSNPLRGSADNVLSLTGSSCYYAKWTVPNGWTIDFQNGTYIDADDWVANGADAALTTCRFSGPVNFSGDTRVTVRTNRVATLAGPVSGSGTIKVDGGWLNLNSDNVTYTGRIDVVSKDGHGPASRAGLGLRTDTTLPLAGISLTDADLKLADAYASSLPPLAFTGTGTGTVKGGLQSNARMDGAAIYVTNGATVEISSPIAVTGVTEIVNGTLRIPATQDTFVGNPGLMGYEDHPASMVWWFDKPTAAQIASTYTNFYPRGTDLLTAKTSSITTYRLHGYIWNRSATNETWSFWANFNDRAFVWMDDAVIFSNTASYNAAEKRCKTVADVTPGAHEIILNFTANATSSGPQWWSTEDGYCGIAIDKRGRGMTSNVTSYYKPLIDPGDGSLLTVDNSPTVADARWVPSFTNVVFGANGVLDCNEHALTVGTLAGFGTVTNAATLTVAEKFVLKVSDAASAPLKVDGTLAFADGAVIDFDDYTVQPSGEQRRAIRAGIVVAQAAEITGTPTLQPWLKTAGYRIRKQGNTLVLTMAQGLMMIVK